MHFSKMFITFLRFKQPFGSNRQMTQTLRCEKRIGLPTCMFTDVILQQTVDQIYVRADQFVGASNVLYKVITMMSDEFQIQIGNISAGIAGAGRAAMCRITSGTKG